MWNEAAQNIAGWKTKRPAIAAGARSDDLRTLFRAATTVEATSGIGALLRGTGPWQWGSISRLFLFSRGVVYVPGTSPPVRGPVGRWKAHTKGGEEAVQLTLCGKTYTLRFADATAPWAFEATGSDGATTSGSLADRRQHTQLLLADQPVEHTRPTPNDVATPPPLLGEVAGSGPWFWAGSGPLGFMRGGVLITPWGEGVWGVTRSSGDKADADTVFADFANSQHNVKMHNPQCIRMSSRRKADGDRVGIDFAGTGADDTCSAQP
jgi:hypothetical protein